MTRRLQIIPSSWCLFVLFICSIPLHINVKMFGGECYNTFRELGSSFFSNFILPWKTITLFALVTTKHCSHIALLQIENKNLYFFSVTMLVLYEHLVGRQINCVIFHLILYWISFQHMPISKMISCLVKKANISSGTLQGAMVYVACVCLLSLLQTGEWARVSILARQYFSTYITICTRIWFSMLFQALVSR